MDKDGRSPGMGEPHNSASCKIISRAIYKLPFVNWNFWKPNVWDVRTVSLPGFVAISSNLRFHFRDVNISSLFCVKSEIHYMGVWTGGKRKKAPKNIKVFFDIRALQNLFNLPVRWCYVQRAKLYCALFYPHNSSVINWIICEVYLYQILMIIH